MSELRQEYKAAQKASKQEWHAERREIKGKAFQGKGEKRQALRESRQERRTEKKSLKQKFRAERREARAAKRGPFGA